MKKYYALILVFLACFLPIYAKPQDSPEYDSYGEEYYYQEYDEDDLGYYSYSDGYDDVGASREEEPYVYTTRSTTTTTTTTTTTYRTTRRTTRRPYRRPTTTQRPYYETTR